MKHNIDEQATHLIEGSVWQNRHGKTYTVLFVTNLTVSHKMSSRLIPSVTFINADGAVFSLDCDSFLRAYTYVEDNDLMMSCLEQVYKCNAGELEDSSTDAFIDELEQEVGTEEVEQPKAETTQETVQTPAETEQPVEQGRTLAEQIAKPFVIDFVTQGNPKLSNQELASAFEGYSSYMDSRGVMFHKLYFAPQNSVVAYTLNQTFNPTVAQDDYDLIHLNTGCTDFDIKWNAFGYIGAEIINGKEYLVVVLADEPEDILNQAEDQVETEQPVEEVTASAEQTEEQEEHDDSSSIELVNVEPVEEPEQAEQVEVAEQSEPQVEEPKIIAHLASPLDGIQVVHVQPVEAEQTQQTEEPIEINVDDVTVEQPKSEQESIDDYFDVVDITDVQAEQVAEQVNQQVAKA